MSSLRNTPWHALVMAVVVAFASGCGPTEPTPPPPGSSCGTSGSVCQGASACCNGLVCTVYDGQTTGTCRQQCADSLSDCQFQEKCCNLSNITTAVCIPENLIPSSGANCR